MAYDYDNVLNEITEYIQQRLTEKRLKHTLGVCKTAEELAVRFGADAKKAKLAAMFHDMYRSVSVNQMNGYAKLLELDDKYLDNPNLAHSKVAAVIMERDFGVDDKDIINAVSFHTTGRPNMSVLEKVVFLADAIEPNRVYPDVDKIRELAKTNLDEACIFAMEHTIEYLNSQNAPIDSDTLSALEFLKKENI